MAFQLGGVNNDDERYANLLVSLEGDALRAVGDLVNNPPGVNKFLALKERLVNHFAPTPESQLRRMLRGEDMSGKKPSAILAHMRHLSDGRCDSSIMRTLFYDRLPENMCTVLLATGQEDLDKLAEVGDRIFDMSNAHLCTVSNSTPLPARLQEETVQAISRKDTTLDEIRASIEALRKEVQDLKMKNQPHSRSTSRSRSQSRQRTTESNKGTKLCYFHQKFGDEARRCKTGCPKWTEN